MKIGSAWLWLLVCGCATVGDEPRVLDDACKVAPEGADAAVEAALNAFHRAAAEADEDTYFALLPDDAVFLGTDPAERWTGREFREFAMPYFHRASAWVYEPRDRFVTVDPARGFAWFDEMLDNKSYGVCRGSGVMEYRNGAWVIRQYNLSIPVPNDLAADLAARIRAMAKK
jgi:hypothetical protein